MTGEASTPVVPERRCFIDGRFVDGVSVFDDISPVDGSVIARVHEADRALVHDAVKAGRRALDRGPWGISSVEERAGCLRRIAHRLEDRFDDLVAAEVADTGKPLGLAQELDVARAVRNFRVFADLISAQGTESYCAELPGGLRALNYAFRKPVGVVAIVVPWNLPLLLLTWKVAPALACGNAVVVKPSEETPSSATVLAEIMAEVGLPQGVYNLVHGFGPNSAGELLTTAEGIDAVTFTGESATGSIIMRAVAPRAVPVSLELGGKNPAIVFADADLDTAIDGLVRSVFTNTGQICLCTERVYVQRPVFDDVTAGLVERAKRLVLGRPDEVATTTGPLISTEHRAKVLEYFKLAESDGASLLVGGGVPDLGRELSRGAWIEPTLWTGLGNRSRAMREEIFGPVAGLVPFDDDAEAVALANDSPFGLAGCVWTRDLARAHLIAQALDVGIVWVNDWYRRDLRTPFGGTGLSGIGREGGSHSLEFYSELTNVSISM